MRISIIMPMLNAEAYVAQTIRSALNQSRPPHEILVIDNGSTDRSAEVARSFGEPVRVLHEPVAGASSARLTGVAAARGDALMFLDADDLIGPTVLEELAAVLIARPGSVACCPWRRYELVDGAWRTRPASCAPRGPGQDPLAAWLSGWYHPPCSILWSVEAYQASGGWDPAINVDDDGDLMMRALAAGVRLGRTEGGTAYYRRLPGEAVSLSGQRLTSKGMRSRLTVIEKVERKLAENGRAGQFHLPLKTAFRNIATDAEGRDPDLFRRAMEGVRRNVPWLREYITDWLGRARWLLPSRRDRNVFRSSARPAPLPNLPSPSVGRPLVSVIIPTYNRAELTAAALDSLLAQSYDRFEILIVDDASTDETAAVMAARTDPRIRYIRQPQNRGVAAARNRGIGEASGSLIAFLDSDDEWLPYKLESQIDLVQKRSDAVGLFYTGAVERWEHGDESWIPEARGDVHVRMLHTNVLHVTTSSALVRREVFDTVGLFDEALTANEDHDLWTRIAAFFQFDFVPEPLIVYAHHETSHSSGEPERRSRNFAANMQARLAFLDLHGAEAKRAGVKHLYHLDCARRHLEAPYGRAGQARAHLAKAVIGRPGETRLLFWLLFSLLPSPLRSSVAPRLKRLRTRIPARLWFGAGSSDHG